jgi:hypothetical protein
MTVGKDGPAITGGPQGPQPGPPSPGPEAGGVAPIVVRPIPTTLGSPTGMLLYERGPDYSVLTGLVILALFLVGVYLLVPFPIYLVLPLVILTIALQSYYGTNHSPKVYMKGILIPTSIHKKPKGHPWHFIFYEEIGAIYPRRMMLYEGEIHPHGYVLRTKNGGRFVMDHSFGRFLTRKMEIAFADKRFERIYNERYAVRPLLHGKGWDDIRTALLGGPRSKALMYIVLSLAMGLVLTGLFVAALWATGHGALMSTIGTAGQTFVAVNIFVASVALAYMMGRYILAPWEDAMARVTLVLWSGGKVPHGIMEVFKAQRKRRSIHRAIRVQEIFEADDRKARARRSGTAVLAILEVLMLLALVPTGALQSFITINGPVVVGGEGTIAQAHLDVPGQFVVNNTYIEFNDVHVRDGGTLKVERSIVALTGDDPQLGLVVDKGGTLIVENSTILKPDEDERPYLDHKSPELKFTLDLVTMSQPYLSFDFIRERTLDRHLEPNQRSFFYIEVTDQQGQAHTLKGELSRSVTVKRPFDTDWRVDAYIDKTEGWSYDQVDLSAFRGQIVGVNFKFFDAEPGHAASSISFVFNAFKLMERDVGTTTIIPFGHNIGMSNNIRRHSFKTTNITVHGSIVLRNSTVSGTGSRSFMVVDRGHIVIDRVRFLDSDNYAIMMMNSTGVIEDLHAEMNSLDLRMSNATVNRIYLNLSRGYQGQGIFLEDSIIYTSSKRALGARMDLVRSTILEENEKILSVVAVNYDGSPIPGARVTLIGPTGAVEFSGSTGHDGYANISIGRSYSATGVITDEIKDLIKIPRSDLELHTVRVQGPSRTYEYMVPLDRSRELFAYVGRAPDLRVASIELNRTVATDYNETLVEANVTIENLGDMRSEDFFLEFRGIYLYSNYSDQHGLGPGERRVFSLGTGFNLSLDRLYGMNVTVPLDVSDCRAEITLDRYYSYPFPDANASNNVLINGFDFNVGGIWDDSLNIYGNHHLVGKDITVNGDVEIWGNEVWTGTNVTVNGTLYIKWDASLTLDRSTIKVRGYPTYDYDYYGGGGLSLDDDGTLVVKNSTIICSSNYLYMGRSTAVFEYSKILGNGTFLFSSGYYPPSLLYIKHLYAPGYNLSFDDGMASVDDSSLGTLYIGNDAVVLSKGNTYRNPGKWAGNYYLAYGSSLVSEGDLFDGGGIAQAFVLGAESTISLKGSRLTGFSEAALDLSDNSNYYGRGPPSIEARNVTFSDSPVGVMLRSIDDLDFRDCTFKNIDTFAVDEKSDNDVNIDLDSVRTLVRANDMSGAKLGAFRHSSSANFIFNFPGLNKNKLSDELNKFEAEHGFLLGDYLNGTITNLRSGKSEDISFYIDNDMMNDVSVENFTIDKDARITYTSNRLVVSFDRYGIGSSTFNIRGTQDIDVDVRRTSDIVLEDMTPDQASAVDGQSLPVTFMLRAKCLGADCGMARFTVASGGQTVGEAALAGLHGGEERLVPVTCRLPVTATNVDARVVREDNWTDTDTDNNHINRTVLLVDGDRTIGGIIDIPEEIVLVPKGVLLKFDGADVHFTSTVMQTRVLVGEGGRLLASNSRLSVDGKGLFVLNRGDIVLSGSKVVEAREYLATDERAVAMADLWADPTQVDVPDASLWSMWSFGNVTMTSTNYELATGIRVHSGTVRITDSLISGKWLTDQAGTHYANLGAGLWVDNSTVSIVGTALTTYYFGIIAEDSRVNINGCNLTESTEGVVALGSDLTVVDSGLVVFGNYYNNVNIYAYDSDVLFVNDSFESHNQVSVILDHSAGSVLDSRFEGYSRPLVISNWVRPASFDLSSSNTRAIPFTSLVWGRPRGHENAEVLVSGNEFRDCDKLWGINASVRLEGNTFNYTYGIASVGKDIDYSNNTFVKSSQTNFTVYSKYSIYRLRADTGTGALVMDYDAKIYYNDQNSYYISNRDLSEDNLPNLYNEQYWFWLPSYYLNNSGNRTPAHEYVLKVDWHGEKQNISIPPEGGTLVPIMSCPDLKIGPEDVVVLGTNHTIGSPVQVMVTVHNIGSVEAAGPRVEAYVTPAIGSNTRNYKKLDAIGPGESKTVYLDVKPTSTNTTVKIRVDNVYDSKNKHEARDGNNVVSFNLTASSPVTPTIPPLNPAPSNIDWNLLRSVVGVFILLMLLAVLLGMFLSRAQRKEQEMTGEGLSTPLLKQGLDKAIDGKRSTKDQGMTQGDAHRTVRVGEVERRADEDRFEKGRVEEAPEVQDLWSKIHDIGSDKCPVCGSKKIETKGKFTTCPECGWKRYTKDLGAGNGGVGASSETPKAVKRVKKTKKS